MAIQWNKVTWYSKLFAVVVFILTFWAAFWLGAQYEEVLVTRPTDPVAGMQCGGFIRNAPTCPADYHCQLSHTPDTGGVCVHD